MVNVGKYFSGRYWRFMGTHGTLGAPANQHERLACRRITLAIGILELAAEGIPQNITDTVADAE
jgi:hypothetical protein